MTGRRVVVEADGGSRGNPGPAGYGALVRDAETGELLDEVAEGIGVASNNVAEYRGLIAGLEAAKALSASDVHVRMDSKLVVEQMSGRWKVKHPDMQVLAKQASALVRSLPAVRFSHIRRELNGHADKLANQAMDDQAAGRAWRGRAGAAAPVPAAVTAEKPQGERPAAGAGSDARPAKAKNSLYGWSGPTATPTVAMLLRHGETVLSVDRRFSGRGDAPLTERGRAQAAASAERLAGLGVEAIVASPLRRTRETATAVAERLGLELSVDEGFMETDFGQWEGSTFAEVFERAPEELRAWLDDPTVAPPGGESMVITEARVMQAKARALVEHPGQRIVIVSHVTPIKLMLRESIGAPLEAIYRLHLDPASLSVVDWFPDRPGVVRLMNGTTHLGEHATGAGH